MAESASERYEKAKAERKILDAKYKGQNLKDLLKQMRALRIKLDDLDEKKKPLQKEYDYLCMMRVPETADDEGVASITMKFGKETKRLQLTGDMFVSMINTTKAMDWLRDNGHGDVIKTEPYVESATLKGVIKTAVEADEQPPTDAFRMTPFTRASLVKV